MDADPHARPSRRAWPLRTQPTTTPAGTHDHNLPRWLFRAVVGGAITSLLILALIAVLLVYILGRGAERDQQFRDVDQRINDAICDLLDQLPEGGLLERPRQKYGCGDGIPLDELPADIRDRYEAHRPASTPTEKGS